MNREELQVNLSAKPVAEQVSRVASEVEGFVQAVQSSGAAILRAQVARVYFEHQKHLADRVFAAVKRAVGQPCPWTQAEVGDSFVEHCFVGADNEFEICYEHLVRSLVARTSRCEGPRFRLTEVFPVGPSDRALPIWSNQHFNLSLVGSDISGFKSGVTYGQLTGECTLPALMVAQDEVGAASRSVLESMVMAGTIEGVHYHLVYGVFTAGGRTMTDAADEDQPWEGVLWPLRRCLEAYFSDSEKKDSLHRRIRNAAQLLKQADQQEHPAVKLALSFSAIEALVCQKTEGIVDELTRRVSTLLQPNPDRRLDQMDWIRELYRSRSKLLHGEKVESDAVQAMKVRILAAYVLLAVLQWEQFQKRMETRADPPELGHELEAAQTAGKRFVGPGVEFDWEKDGQSEVE